MATARGRETGQQSRKSVNEALIAVCCGGTRDWHAPCEDSMEPSFVARWDLGQQIAKPRDQALCGGAKRAAANSFLRTILAESKMPPAVAEEVHQKFPVSSNALPS